MSDNTPIGIEAFEEEDEVEDSLIFEAATDRESAKAQSGDTVASSDTSAAGDGAKKEPGFFTRHAKKINLVLVVLLAAAITIIIQQQGAKSGGGQGMLPDGHPDISQVSPGSHATPDFNTSEVEKLQQQMQKEPQNPESAKALGKIYFDQGYYTDAVTNFREAAKRAPNDIEVQMMLGTSLYGMSDYEGAKSAWERATEIDPTKAEPWYDLGFVYIITDPPDYDSAKKVWAKVMELAPNSDMATEVQKHLDSIAKKPATNPSPAWETR